MSQGDFNMTITDLIKLRHNLKLTQKQAALFCEVPLITWQSWEQGKREPAAYVLDAIYEKLLKYKED